MKEFKKIKKPIKVIFLDIDGVLNTGNYMHYQWIKERKKKEHVHTICVGMN